MRLEPTEFDKFCNRLAGHSVRRAASALLFATACAYELRVQANPDGPTVTRGSATITTSGNQLNIQASQNAVLDWQHFNINLGETTTFYQPSASSVVWNRINDINPSQILGNLNANGYVVLYNQNGFYFGSQSVVNVGGLVVTTAAPAPVDPGSAGVMWQFSGPPPLASIINYGQIKAKSGGSVFLIAENIENSGSIAAPDGTLGLYAGKEVLISERPDGRGLSASVRLPEGSVDNKGQLIADAGTIALRAQVVNQEGFIEANSVRERNGVIELVAGDSLQLGSTSSLRANGGAEQGNGGEIRLKSEGRFSDSAGSIVMARGGEAGGDGGQISISGRSMQSLNSTLDAGALTGWQRGSLTLDPTDILIANEGGDPLPASGSAGPSGGPDVLRLDVNTSFRNFSHITLQASRDILIGDPLAQNSGANGSVLWNLNDSTGISDPGSLLTLQAGRNILFEQNSKIVAGSGWSMQMTAGADFSAAGKAIKGVGSIYLNGGPADINGVKPNGNGSIETSDGSIQLLAGNEISVGAGYIRTTGGGNIQIQTEAGDVDAGIKPDGYQFSRIGYQISSSGIGGIGTANGGDVSINAGRDILSFLATIGAYGAGNVDLTAGQRIFGTFQLRNGAGHLRAGMDIGSAASPVTLNLIAGGWQLDALGDVFINEVRNPNGTFNVNKPGAIFNGVSLPVDKRVSFLFDYAEDAYFKVNAGKGIELLGSNLQRQTSNRDMLPIYPPVLELTANAGDVLLGNDTIVFPSPDGSVKITTHNGGSLLSTPDRFYQLVMSGSDDPNYKTFATGNAAVPLHLTKAADPVEFLIDGSVENVFLRMPKKAIIDIGGDTLNFGYEGQHLTANDVTEIKIAGDFKSRSKITVVSTATDPDLSILDPAVSSNPELGARISYNAATKELEFNDRMTPAERDFFLHPTVHKLDVNGLVQVDDSGIPIEFPTTFTTDTSAIQQLYTKSQDIPSSGLAYAGLQVAGPGKLIVQAHSLDLGITKGIRTGDLAVNTALAAISTKGADIEVDLQGGLDMTSSQIASFGGGSIAIDSRGSLNVGAQRQFTSDDTPKGIYTANGGNVSVTAGGDVNVNGSRIASYNGGNVSVTSETGNINAGEGARGIFTVTTQQINPVTGQVEPRNDNFFGSGIMALTRPDSDAVVGNINVSAPEGSILANSGGILQLAFNHVDTPLAAVTLNAGKNIEANLSGVLGVNVDLKAGGDVTGVLVASRDINISADQKVSVTALASGGITVEAGSSVSGTLMAGGGLNVSGDSIGAALLSSSGNTQTSGESSGAKVGAFNNVSAPTATRAVDDAAQTVAETKETKLEEDDSKKKKALTLTKTTGRVTVILPKTGGSTK